MQIEMNQVFAAEWCGLFTDWKCQRQAELGGWAGCCPVKHFLLLSEFIISILMGTFDWHLPAPVGSSCQKSTAALITVCVDVCVLRLRLRKTMELRKTLCLEKNKGVYVGQLIKHLIHRKLILNYEHHYLRSLDVYLLLSALSLTNGLKRERKASLFLLQPLGINSFKWMLFWRL